MFQDKSTPFVYLDAGIFSAAEAELPKFKNSIGEFAVMGLGYKSYWGDVTGINFNFGLKYQTQDDPISVSEINYLSRQAFSIEFKIGISFLYYRY
jgi:hypothetical protein